MIRVSILGLALALSCFSQSKPVSPDTKQSGSKTEIPIHALSFQETGPVAGLASAPALRLPFQCLADGTLFLNVVTPPPDLGSAAVSENVLTLYAVRNRKAQKLVVNSVPGLKDLYIQDFFPAGDHIVFLVSAKAVSQNASHEGGPRSGTQLADAEESNMNNYLITLGLDGQYRDKLIVPNDLILDRFGVFPSGEVIVAGYDRAGNQPMLRLLDPRGAVIQAIDQPMTADERNAGDRTPNSTELVTHGDTILAWRSGTRDPVLEISKTGVLRTIRIAVPPGSQLGSFVPSDDLLLASMLPAAKEAGKAVNVSEATYYEISPLDGSLTQKLTVAGAHNGPIACKSNKQYFSYAPDKDGKLVESVAQ